MKKVLTAMILFYVLFIVMFSVITAVICTTQPKAFSMTVEESEQYHNQIQANYAKYAQGEIQRNHELEVETAKFRNAIILERAGASNINVDSTAINENTFIRGKRIKHEQPN